MFHKMIIRTETIALTAIVLLNAYFLITLGDSWFANMPSLLRDVSWLGIVAIGQAVVIISGEFDLSVGSVYAFVSMVFVLLLNAVVNPYLAVLLVLGLGVLIGYINGILTWKLKLPSLLVTLGFLFFYRGIVEYLTDGNTITIDDAIRESFAVQVLGGKTFDLHNSIFIALTILIVVSAFMAKAKFGNHVYATGGDEAAAVATGVPVGWVKIRVFVLCSSLAGAAGVITACNLSSVSTTTATSMEFEAIAASVIGGCVLLGGAGTVWGAILGVATLLTLKHGLILTGTNIFAYQILLGTVLVGMVAIRGAFQKFLGAK